MVVSYGYTNGILSSVSDGSSQANCGTTGTLFWEANAENADRQITEETLGNGIVTNRTYDAVTHWLGSLEAGVGSGAGVKNLSFLYDEMGNVIQRQDGNLGLTENIHYDNDYRLSYTDLGSTQNLSISYDPTGNITSRSDVASGHTWTYDPNRKHAVTVAGGSPYTYSYDANGNMTTREGSTINWSSYNYPTSIVAGSGSTLESVSLYYGPDRQRWYQYYTGNGTTEGTYYVGNDLEVVKSGSTTNYRHYIYAGDEPVAVYSRSSSGTNAVDYVLSDHQGSVAALTNSSGAAVVNESFTPYGNRRNPTTWSGAASNSDLTAAAAVTRQGYTFQTQLGLWMGMNHMNGRVQDSVTGRFLSADPNIPDPTDPQSYNRYSYTLNDPLTYTDPHGFCPTYFVDEGAWYDDGTTCEVDVPGTIPPELQWPSGTPPWISTPQTPNYRGPGGSSGTQQPATPPNSSIAPSHGPQNRRPPNISCQDPHVCLPQTTPQTKSPNSFQSAVCGAADTLGNEQETNGLLAGLTLLSGQGDLMSEIDGLSDLGHTVSTVGTATATGINAFDVAYNIHAGHYVNAVFGAADFMIDATLTAKAGVPGLLLGAAFDFVGGTKAAAAGGAGFLCLGSKLFGSTSVPSQ